jgi:nitroreductase
MDVIFRRRSIRRFTSEAVPRETLRALVKAGMAAPSANNEQPWHFVVMDERPLLDAVPQFHPYARMLLEAPAAILVCGEAAREKSPGYWVQDCSAAVENILLEIVDRGYGGVWLGIHPREERISGMRDLLGIPSGITPFALIAVGRPAETRPPAERFSEERLHFNRWS